MCEVSRLQEVWKSIEGYEDLYIVSNLGRVKNVQTDRFLNGYINKNGYTVITLTKDGQSRYLYLHRLVAIHFIDNPENKPEVDHIIPVSDGGGNGIDNLRWATPKENTNNPISKAKSDKLKIGRKPPKNAIKRAKEVLIIDKVVGIHKENGSIIIFESAEDAKRNGYRHVLECCRGQRGTDKGYVWYFYSDAIANGILKEEE